VVSDCPCRARRLGARCGARLFGHGNAGAARQRVAPLCHTASACRAREVGLGVPRCEVMKCVNARAAGHGVVVRDGDMMTVPLRRSSRHCGRTVRRANAACLFACRANAAPRHSAPCTPRDTGRSPRTGPAPIAARSTAPRSRARHCHRSTLTTVRSVRVTIMPSEPFEILGVESAKQ
jgi:hypothetical protein